MKKLLFLLVAVAVVFTGCETTGNGDIDQALVQILSGQQALNFGSDGTSKQDISFIALYDWSVSTSDSWINVSPSSGKAGQECLVTVTLDKNETYDSRSGKITIFVQGTGFDINVTQAQKNALILSDSTIEIAQEGGSFEIEVQHNIDYTVSIEEGCDWIQQATSRALTSSKINFVASENDSNSSRSAVITVSGGNITESVTVSQNRKVPNAGDNNVILYTQAEGVTSSLNFYAPDASAFGANIVSHTYANGQGEIIFDGPITKIGYYIFRDRTTLTSITIPNSVTLIDNGAFYRCSSLADITIPNSVTKIGQAAFEGCESLTTITIPDSVTEIGGSAFNSCTSLTSITIPDSVTDMKMCVFDGCTALTDVTIGKGLTTIPAGTFRSCSGLRSIVIPDNIVAIEGSRSESSAGGSLYWYGAFQWCRNLTEITIGKGLKKIEDTAFFGTSNIKRVYISDLSKWCQVSFDSSSENPLYNADELYLNNKLVTDLVIPNDITEICCFAFVNYDKLKSVTFPKNLTKIGDGAFSGCTSLTDIVFPESLTALGDGYSASTDIADGGFSMIGGGSVQPDVWGAFYGCTGITNITIPEGVTSINGKVFAGCNNLEIVHALPTTVPTLDGSPFPTTLKKIFVPSSSYIDYVSKWGQYASLIFADGNGGGDNPSTDSDNRVLHYTTSDNNPITLRYTTFGAKVVLHTYENGQGKIVCDGPITSIGDDGNNAPFSGCATLTSVTIPNSVTLIGGSAFRKCSSLASITIPDSVTKIRSSAFYECTSLTSITIPDGVTYIDDYTFYNCTSLTSITIPNSVTWIGDSAFSNCTSLTSITIPNSVTLIGKRAFESCDSLARVDISNLSAWCKISFDGYEASPLSSGAKLYLNGSELTDITIPSDITEIKNYTFCNCTSLTNVTIGNSVTSIGYEAFYGCKSLTSVSIPNSVTSIGKYAFSGCKSLTSVTIPDSVTSIGNNAFYNCTGELIVNCNIPDGYADIYSKESAFYGSKFTKVTIGDSVTSIGDYAFYECTLLTSITIPDSVTSIGNYAFYGCSKMQYIYYNGELLQWCNINMANESSCPAYSSGILLINSNILSGEIVIPDGAKHIPSGTFRGNTLITKVTIPDSVTEIGVSAFNSCTSLTSVTIGNGVTSIGGSAFSGCTSLTSITIPDSVTSIGGAAFYNCTSLTSITIPNSVTSIGNSTFYNCKSLTSITIPNSVTSIGNSAFYNCKSLTSITIPDSVTSIGNGAFYNCKSLTRVDITDLSAWCKIGFKEAYSANPLCNGAKLYLNGSELTDITIPSDITEIKYFAFYYCTSLTSVTIPDSVTSIGGKAFAYCESLTSVYCKPTTPPSLNSSAFSGANITTIFVPTSAVNLYKISSGWSSYADKIVGHEF